MMLMLSTEERRVFENKARTAGFTNFERRGNLYALSELNTLAQGFVMGLTSKPSPVYDPMILDKE